MKKIIFLSSLFFNCLFLVTAQDSPKINKDKFSIELEAYKAWLKSQNLNNYIEFNIPAIKITDTRTVLNLTFKVKGVDESIGCLKQLNTFWTTQNGFTLEESLFMKAINTFEILPQNLIIRFKSKLDDDGIGVDSRIKYTRDLSTGIFIITPFSFLRSIVKDSIEVYAFEMPKVKQIVNDSITNKITKQKYHERKFCDIILNAAKLHFKEKGSLGFNYPLNNNVITFEIKNLKNEVLEPGLISLFDPYEKLVFTIKVIFNEIDQKLSIYTIVDGKYGPSLYKPTSKEYHEMFPKFSSDLINYSQNFTRNNIRSWLKKLP